MKLFTGSGCPPSSKPTFSAEQVQNTNIYLSARMQKSFEFFMT